jgi:predicted alpha/beta superfamily hydrolase
MKNILLLLTIMISMSMSSQILTDTVKSQNLDEYRILKISLPPNYAKNKDKKYPLLFLLDGNYLFDAFNGALTYGYYWDDLPEVIVVAVNQGRKELREADCAVDQQTGLPIEKGAKFFDFLSLELLPAIEKKYRISPYRIIAGHDFTAGFMNLFLYRDEPFFNGYIAMSPELGPAMEARLPERLANVKKPYFYYLSSADGDLKTVLKPIADLDKNMQTIKNPNLFYQFDNFKDASHYSLVLFSVPNALYHLFGAFQPISTIEYQDKIEPLKSDYVGYLVKRYDLIEKSFGMKIKIRVNDFQAIEAAIMKNNAFDELEALSVLARKNYPKSMLADYEMALMYEKKTENKKAAKSYLSAFQKEEIGDLTKNMMYDRAEIMKKSYGGDKKSKNKGKNEPENNSELDASKEKEEEVIIDPNAKLAPETNPTEEVKTTSDSKTISEIKPVEVIKSSGEVKTEEVVKPIEEIKVIEEVKATEVVKPLEVVKPMEEIKVIEEVKATEVVKPIEEVKIIEEVKPTEGVKSAEETKPVETIKPLEEIKSADAIKPTEELKNTEEIKPTEEKKQ